MYIKWILIKNIHSLLFKKSPQKTVYVFNQYPLISLPSRVFIANQ